MKIVVYTESYLPNMGGLERNTRMLCRTLAETNQVILLTPVLKNLVEDDQEEFITIRSKSQLVYAKYILNCDLLVVNGGVALKPLIWALIGRINYWLIYQMATLYFPSNMESLKGKMNWAIRNHLAKKAWINIAVSEYSKLQLHKLITTTRVEALINPFDKDLEVHINSNIISKSSSNPYKLLFAGRITEGKGILLLIEVLKEIESVHPGLFQLDIAGEGDKLYALLDSIHSNEIFLYHGRVDQKQLIQLYQSSHLTIIPSTTHIEGSPLTMAESIYCKTPVLISDQPAMINSMGNAGYSFSSGNKQSLKEALLKYADSSDFRNSLSKNAIERAETFSASFYSNQLNKLINSYLTDKI